MIESTDGENRPSDPPEPEDSPAAAPAIALGVALLVTVLAAGAVYVGFAPERQAQRGPFYALGGLYLVMGTAAVLRMRRRDEMVLLRPKSGDITFAALVAFLLFGLAFVFHALVTAPGSKGHGWIVRVYLLLGDPMAEGRHLVAIAAALVGLLEELTWRGLVTPVLEERFGVLKASATSTILYAAAHVPAIWALADVTAGPNPLLPIAAFGCGAAWSYLRWRMERLPPVLISHALFTWMFVEFPLWQ